MMGVRDIVIPMKDEMRFCVVSRPSAGYYRVDFHISNRKNTLVGYSVFDNYTETIHSQVNWLAVGVLPEIMRNPFTNKVVLMTTNQ